MKNVVDRFLDPTPFEMPTAWSDISQAMALPEFEQRETLEALDTIAKPAGLHIGSRTVALERLGGLTNRNYKVTLGPTERAWK